MEPSIAAPEITLVPEDRACLAGDLGPAKTGGFAPASDARVLLPRRKLAVAAIVTIGIAASFAFSGKGGEAASATEAIAAVTPVKQAWIDIIQPFQLYALPAPELDKKPRVYTAVREGGILLTLRYLDRPRRRRDTEEILWEGVLDAFGAVDDLDFAYPTVRQYRAPQEAKSGLRRPELPPAADED